jgi:hypothetical protein
MYRDPASHLLYCLGDAANLRPILLGGGRDMSYQRMAQGIIGSENFGALLSVWPGHRCVCTTCDL